MTENDLTRASDIQAEIRTLQSSLSQLNEIRECLIVMRG